MPSFEELSSGGIGAGQYYRARYHRKGEDGRSYVDDDVDRYCPDRELLMELYSQAEELEKKQLK